jgi:hypothetical protein
MCSVLMVSLLALAGCSGGDGGGSGTSTTVGTFPTTAPAKVDAVGHPSSADQKAAESAVLRKDDLEGKWKSAPWTTGDQPFFRTATGDCADLHLADRPDDLTARTHSDVLLSPASATVGMQIHVFATEAAATAAMAPFIRSTAAKCVGSTVSAMKNEQGAINSAGLTLGRSAVTVPGAVAFYGSTQAGALKLFVGYAVAQRGRALVLLNTSGPGAGQVPDFDSYLSPVVKRLSSFE